MKKNLGIALIISALNLSAGGDIKPIKDYETIDVTIATQAESKELSTKSEIIQPKIELVEVKTVSPKSTVNSAYVFVNGGVASNDEFTHNDGVVGFGVGFQPFTNIPINSEFGFAGIGDNGKKTVVFGGKLRTNISTGTKYLITAFAGYDFIKTESMRTDSGVNVGAGVIYDYSKKIRVGLEYQRSDFDKYYTDVDQIGLKVFYKL